MTGISEILVLILLICGLLIIPRMFKPAPTKAGTALKPAKSFSAKMRAGIVASVLVPVAAALILQPWKGNALVFFTAGILPVALAWGLFWILSARKH